MKHKLLIDQVKKHLDGLEKIHPQLESFINDVNCSYQQFDGQLLYFNHASLPLLKLSNANLTQPLSPE